MKFWEALREMQENGRKVRFCYLRNTDLIMLHWDHTLHTVGTFEDDCWRPWKIDEYTIMAEFELVEEPNPKKRLTLVARYLKSVNRLNHYYWETALTDDMRKEPADLILTTKCACGKECEIGVDVDS